MTLREHLKGLHKNAAEHHSIKEAHHRALSGHYRKLAKLHKVDADTVDAAGVYEGVSDSHAGLADHHAAQAEFHTTAMEECEKAVASELNKVIPDRISGVTPTAPAFGSSVRPVLRTGQREFEKPSVPLEFESLVAIEDSLD
jgi:hypothetical protein